MSDIIRWHDQVIPGRTLEQDVARRKRSEVREVSLRGRLLVWRSSEDEAARLLAYLDDLRDAAGRRAVASSRTSRASLLADYDARRAAHVQLKLTWTGPQKKPVPGLFLATTHGPADASAFRAFRRRGIHYGNDDLGRTRYATTTPESMRKVVAAVMQAPVAGPAMARAQPDDWSLSIVDTGSSLRPNYVELLLQHDEALQLIRSIRAALPEHSTERGLVADLL